MTARVSWISLTAVKALALEQVDEVDLLEDGLRGDRRFFLVDENDRLVNNKDKRRGPLQLVHADYDAGQSELKLRLPDGSVVAGGVSYGPELETTFHRLPLPARRVEGPWDEALSETTGEVART